MGEIAALIAAVTWAATSIAFTQFAARTAPAVISALRLGSASLLLPFVLLFSGQAGDLAEASWQTLAWVIVSGSLAYAVGDTLYIQALGALGMQRTFPISMALFIGLTVAGGVLLLGEDFTWGLPAGAVLIGAGISLIVVPRAKDGLAELAPGEGDLIVAEPEGLKAKRSALSGYFLLLLVGIFWAAASLLLAGKRGELGAVAAGTIRLPAGAIALLAFTAVAQRDALQEPFRDRRHLLAIVVAGVIGTGLGSMMYVYAVVEAGAAKTAVLSATAPLMGLPLAVIFLKEQVDWRVGVGTLLCVLGIGLVVVV